MSKVKSLKPVVGVELVKELPPGDLNDLCDATDAAIQGGGGFGWVTLPSRDILERFWEGVMAMPARHLFVARIDGVICGTIQLIKPPRNNEAQSFSVTLTSVFVAPWARGHGLARMLVEAAEAQAKKEGYGVINIDLRETQEAAIKLYETMDYTLFGTHPYYARVEGKVVPGRYYYKVIDQSVMK
jgi:ribosomal protein S18 acetylase RimI-like enzyme